MSTPVDLDALNRRLTEEPTYPLDKDWLAVRFFLDRADMTKLIEEARLFRAAKEAWKKADIARFCDSHALRCPVHLGSTTRACNCHVAELGAVLS